MGILSKGQKLGGLVMLGWRSLRKLCPPARLRAHSLDKYKASLCMYKIMSLAEYRMVVSR